MFSLHPDIEITAWQVKRSERNCRKSRCVKGIMLRGFEILGGHMPYYRACCIGSSKYFLQLPAELARTSGAEFGGLRELVLI